MQFSWSELPEMMPQVRHHSKQHIILRKLRLANDTFVVVCCCSCFVTVSQWNPPKVDNLEPHILSIIVACPLWRGCIDVNWKQLGPRNLSIIIIGVFIIEGCPLSGVPL